MSYSLLKLDQCVSNILNDTILFKHACTSLPRNTIIELYNILDNILADSDEIKIKQITSILTETDNNIIFEALKAITLFDMISISAMTEVIIKELNNN